MKREPYILIAEDDADDRFLLETAFKEKHLGANLSFVGDGAAVMDYLEAIDIGHSLPDLILLDLNMPLMDGPETLQVLKENGRYKQIPVIIHSTSENERDRHNCLSLGASEYLNKGSGYDKVQAAAQFIYDFAIKSDKFQAGYL